MADLATSDRVLEELGKRIGELELALRDVLASGLIAWPARERARAVLGITVEQERELQPLASNRDSERVDPTIHPVPDAGTARSDD